MWNVAEGCRVASQKQGEMRARLRASQLRRGKLGV